MHQRLSFDQGRKLAIVSCSTAIAGSQTVRSATDWNWRIGHPRRPAGQTFPSRSVRAHTPIKRAKERGAGRTVRRRRKSGSPRPHHKPAPRGELDVSLPWTLIEDEDGLV